MMSTKKVSTGALLALFAIIAILTAAHPYLFPRLILARSKQDLPVQMADRGTRIFRAASGYDGALTLTTEQGQTFGPDGLPRRHRVIDFADRSGVHLGRVEWDDVTGEIRQISVVNELAKHGRGRLDESTAVRTTWEWLHALNIARADERWQLADDPEESGSIWRVTWRFGERFVYLQIDRTSGAIVMVRVWRQPGRLRPAAV